MRWGPFFVLSQESGAGAVSILLLVCNCFDSKKSMKQASSNFHRPSGEVPVANGGKGKEALFGMVFESSNSRSVDIRLEHY